jgi:Uma2 family endonuclease
VCAKVNSMPAPIVSDEDLLQLSAEGYKVELVDGEVRMRPAGMEHEAIVAALIEALRPHVRRGRLGHVFGSSAGYHIPRGHLRSPDVSFVPAERLPGNKLPKGYGDFAPDLAVEVLSPWDEAAAVAAKVAEYLRGGVRLVWIVDPEKRVATVHREGAQVQTVATGEELDGEDVVPGFRCSLRDLFD